LLLPVTIACPSKSSNSGPSFEQQCHDFVDAACSAGAALNLDCSRVRGINGSIDACKADYAAEPCSCYQEPTGLPVPASCKGLLVL
jgi:hypothetical protein